MAWRPVTDQHSIERVRLAVTFERPLPSKLVERLRVAFEERRPALGFQPIELRQGQGITFQLGPSGPVAVQQPETVMGWHCVRTSAEGLSVEFFALEGAALVYESSEYSRWPVFLERLLQVMEPVTDELLRDDDPAAVALEFYDRLWFDGPPEEARPAELLADLGAILPPPVMTDAEMWHLHRGWFETHPQGRLLMGQNMDAQEGQVGDEARRSVQVVTRAEARKGQWTIEGTDLRPHLTVMHDRTKDVFTAILSRDMAQQVGILVE